MVFTIESNRRGGEVTERFGEETKRSIDFAILSASFATLRSIHPPIQPGVAEVVDWLAGFDGLGGWKPPLHFGFQRGPEDL